MNRIEREELKVGDPVTWLKRFKDRGLVYFKAVITHLSPSKVKATIRLEKRTYLLRSVSHEVMVNHLVPGHHHAPLTAKRHVEYKVKGQIPTEFYFVALKRKDRKLPSPTTAILKEFVFSVDEAKEFRSKHPDRSLIGIFSGVMVVKSEIKALDKALTM